MRRIVPILATKGPAPAVLLVLAVLVLGGCGGGGSSGGGGEEETTSASTSGGETTSVETASRTVDLTASRDSGVTGTATLTDTPGGVEVALDVQGLADQPGTEHLAHIHEGGTCADDRADNGATVLYGLDSLYTGDDGTALSSTSIADVTLDELLSGPAKYVNVHAEATGEGVPPGISCADLPGTGTTTGAGGGETTAGGGTSRY